MCAAVFAIFAALPAAAADRNPNDPYFGEQSYLQRINAPAAWVKSLGFEGVIVAVIDSGTDIDHPDLKDNIWTNSREIPGNSIDDDLNGYVDDIHGWDFADGDSDPRPDVSGEYDVLGANHGTISAGIIAARGDNLTGIVGVTWQTSIMPLRALDSNGGSRDPSSIVRAVEYAVHNGASIINLSFVSNSENDLLKIALRRAYDSGVLVVAAAGNAPDGGGASDLSVSPRFPICLDAGEQNFVLGVASTDGSDLKAVFSNYGDCVDVSAPGARFLGLQYYDPYSKDFAQPYGGYFNGTSLSAPVVSGVAALMKAVDRSLTPRHLIDLIRSSSAPIDAFNPQFAGKLGAGRVDADGAVDAVLARLSARVEAAPVAPSASLAPPGDDRVVIAAPGPGRAPEVRMFTTNGLFIRSFLAFPEGFRGGVSVATGNFNGGHHRTIVAGAGPGGLPQIRIFNQDGRVIGGFVVFDPLFRGGVSVATGDVDGDGRDEIIAGAGPGGGPHVRIFGSDGKVISGFFAFDKKLKSGVSVATGDVDGDGRDEIIAATGSGTTTTVRVFDAKGSMRLESRPFGASDRAGAQVAAADVDADGDVDVIIVGRRETAVLNAVGSRVGKLAENGFIRTDRTVSQVPVRELPFAIGDRIRPRVTVYGVAAAAFSFQAFEPSFKGGTRAAILHLLR